MYLFLQWFFARMAHEESSRLYSQSEHPIQRSALSFLTPRVNPGMKVLDLGCGYGVQSVALAPRVESVLGVDKNEDRIRCAKQNVRTQNIEFLCTDIQFYLERTADKFDLVILSHILEHIDHPEAFLNRLKSRTQFLYVEVPDIERDYLTLYGLKVGAKILYSDADHIWEFDREDLLRIFTSCQLQVEASDYRFGMMRFWLRRSMELHGEGAQ